MNENDISISFGHLDDSGQSQWRQRKTDGMGDWSIINDLRQCSPLNFKMSSELVADIV